MDAIVLLSGGLDSYTAAAIAKSQGFRLLALTIRYGQRHQEELAAARRVASALGVVRHFEMDLDLRGVGGSALTADLDVPLDRDTLAPEIPVTYVPARNTIFLSLAMAWAEVSGVSDVVIGVNALDYSGYPDCRQEFLDAFERLATVATKAGTEGRPFRILAPLIAMSKADIIRQGNRLGVDYALTHSCYAPVDGRACGRCDSCILRSKGFAEAGIIDPIEYADY